MTSDAIPEATFVREFVKELHNKNAAIFAGAGLSMSSGYVDWKGLLAEIIQDLGLDPVKEHDLVTLAQYHCNKSGGNRGHLTQTIFNHFSPTKIPTKNHRILASLPIHTYWTTNYDKLIEKSLEDAKKVPDVKYVLKQLPVTRPDRSAVVYKMHGDIDHPSDAVINKDDYEAYPHKMTGFVSALRGDLVEKTFLFLGFSFTDPNLDYILSRVRAQYEQNQRPHYAIQKRVTKETDESESDFKYRQLKQNYFIQDLKRFSISTVLVDNYDGVTSLLEKVADRYRRSSVLISGAADQYGSFSPNDAQHFLHNLSYCLSEKRNRIITGFGVGVGGAVINGALSALHATGRSISDDNLVMRPFPQVATGTEGIAALWANHRKEMIAHAGIAIFVFGNKRGSDGNIVLSNGMRSEFDLCIEAGVLPLPVGATGDMALELWKLVSGELDKYFPSATSEFRADFAQLGDASKGLDALVSVVARLVNRLCVA